MPPELALAASARDWSDKLHRFVLDHGGAVVVGRMMSAEQAAGADYDTLIIDDICSFLHTRLVSELRDSGRSVLGVFDPADGTDAKRRLLDVGIGDVIEADASPEEFIRASVTSRSERGGTVRMAAEPKPGGFLLGTTGPPGGVGVTEVACGVAVALAGSSPTTLVDADLRWPAVSQRLGLPVHPNIVSAVDAVLHEPGRLPSTMHALGDLTVICGLATPGSGQVSAAEVGSVLSAVSAIRSHVVVDLGPVVGDGDDVALSAMDAVLLVGTGSPVGITRLIRTYELVRARVGARCDVGIVVNRLDRNGQRRSEIRNLLAASLGRVPAMFIREDPRVLRSTWDGTSPSRGDFVRSASRLAGLLGAAKHEG